MSNRKSLLHLRALPPTVLALAAVGIGGSALAQTGNPATGAVLYKTNVNFPVSGPLNCSNCHGEGPAFGAFFKQRGTTEAGVLALMTSAITQNKGNMGAYAAWTAQQRADTAAYIMQSTAGAPPPPLTLPPGTPAPPPAPAPAPTPAAPVSPTLSPMATPNPAMFNSTEIGKFSATSGILVTNSTAAALTLATPPLVSPAGTTSEFLVTAAPAGATRCVPGMRLDPGVSCSFGVQFAPLAAGARTEKWTINFLETAVPAREVTLEGTAVATTAAASSTAAPSDANAPTSGGGGALGWLGLLGLAALGAIPAVRRRR